MARLRDLLPVALGRGVQLTVETHVGRLTEVPEVAVRLCREAEGVGLTLDPSHFHAGPNQGADFTAVFPYVRHVHLRDAGTRWEEIQVPAGSGEVDFDALVRGLHGAGYEGKFAIEYIDSIPIVAPAGAPGGEPPMCPPTCYACGTSSSPPSGGRGSSGDDLAAPGASRPGRRRPRPRAPRTRSGSPALVC